MGINQDLYDNDILIIRLLNKCIHHNFIERDIFTESEHIELLAGMEEGDDVWDELKLSFKISEGKGCTLLNTRQSNKETN